MEGLCAPHSFLSLVLWYGECNVLHFLANSWGFFPPTICHIVDGSYDDQLAIVGRYLKDRDPIWEVSIFRVACICCTLEKYVGY